MSRLHFCVPRDVHHSVHLHLSYVEARVDAHHLELAVVILGGGKVSVTCAELPGPDSGAPARNVEDHDALHVGQGHLTAVELKFENTVQVYEERKSDFSLFLARLQSCVHLPLHSRSSTSLVP